MEPLRNLILSLLKLGKGPNERIAEDCLGVPLAHGATDSEFCPEVGRSMTTLSGIDLLVS